MRAQKIRTKPDNDGHPNVTIGGWLSGKTTYFWMGQNDICIGTLSGQKLFRLAKAIVRHMESK